MDISVIWGSGKCRSPSCGSISETTGSTQHVKCYLFFHLNHISAFSPVRDMLYIIPQCRVCSLWERLACLGSVRYVSSSDFVQTTFSLCHTYEWRRRNHLNSPVVLSPAGPKKQSVARASQEFSSWLSFCWLVSHLPSHQTVRSSHALSTAVKQTAAEQWTSFPNWHAASVCKMTANICLEEAWSGFPGDEYVRAAEWVL